MSLHANAELVRAAGVCSLAGRGQGWTLAAAAEAAGVSVRARGSGSAATAGATAVCWIARRRRDGRRTAPAPSGWRRSWLRRLRMTAAEIAEMLEMPLSTVSGVLTRVGTGPARLGSARAGQPLRGTRPGELVHIDVKKLGRIARRRPPALPATQPAEPPRESRPRRTGWEYVHVCVDVECPRFRRQRVVRQLLVVPRSFSRSRPERGSRAWSAV